MDMSVPRTVGPESFAQLVHYLEKGEAEARTDALFEGLFKAQHEVFELALGGAGLDAVLVRVATVLERVAAPARCSVSLFDAGGRLIQHAAPHLGPELRPAGEPNSSHVPGPIEAALVQGARVVACDFQIETRWPIYAGKALVRGLRACWAEPVACGEGRAVVALFHAEPAEPSARDDRALKAAALLAALAVKSCQRGPARGIFPQGQRRSH
jgi:hypothetical protein